jgi:hypothetical protein
MMREKKKATKKTLFKRFLIGGVIVVVGLISYGGGLNGAETSIDGEKATYGDLLIKVDNTETKLKSAQEDVKKEKANLEETKEDAKEVMALMDKQDKIEKDIQSKEKELKEKSAQVDKVDSTIDEKKAKVEEEVAKYEKELEQKNADKKKKLEEENASLDKKIEDKKSKVDAEVADHKQELESKLTSLESDVKEKEDKLASLETGIKEAEGAPITLNAGEYIIDKDVPTGRYKVTNIGRGTNFQVFDSSGSAIVNTILGNGDIGRGDYVFFATENTLIKTAGAVKLIPVE